MIDEKNDKFCINYSFLKKCRNCSGYNTNCKEYESKDTRRIEVEEEISSSIQKK